MIDKFITFMCQLSRNSGGHNLLEQKGQCRHVIGELSVCLYPVTNDEGKESVFCNMSY